jgi:DNA invertase Pin-like site-specific DNA recombinase
MATAIYYRVSTDRQDIASQEQAIKAFILNKSGPFIIYKDQGYSGKDQNRPEFNRMLMDARAKQFDTIVVYKLDRFSRHANTAISLLLELDSYGIAFISVTQPILNLGHENPFRRTILSAFAEIAEIEHETIVSRINAGIAAARQRGQKFGRPRIVSEETANHIKSLRNQKLTFQAIADKLGVPVSTCYVVGTR